MNDTPLRQALGVILDGDGPEAVAGTMQNLCGRAANILVDHNSRAEATVPFVSLLVVANTQVPDGGEVWELTLQFECVARDLELVNKLAHRLSEILTHNALWDPHGLDAAPIGLLRHRDVPAQDELLHEDWHFKLFELDLRWQVVAG